jgi:hypothetical protein
MQQTGSVHRWNVPFNFYFSDEFVLVILPQADISILEMTVG